MPKDVRRTTEAPNDRLGLMAKWMIDTYEGAHPGRGGIRMVVMFTDDKERKSMVALSGYDSDTVAMADIFQHLAAVFEANGKKLLIMPIGKG